MKGKVDRTDKRIIIDIPLLVIYRLSRKKKANSIIDLSKTFTPVSLIDIYKKFYPKRAKQIFFS
jgi:hypothetical protein